MEHGPSIFSLLIVVIAAFLTPIIVHRLKINFLPVVVAEIIVGIILGPSLFNIIEAGDYVNILSTLGFIFLMFLSGLEIDFDAFKVEPKKSKKSESETVENKPNQLVLTTGIFIGILILSVLFAYLFSLFGMFNDIFLMTIVISTISLGVVVPTLKEMNIIRSDIGQTILLVAVIADLVTMIMLAFYGNLNSDSSASMWLMVILIVVGIVVYFVGKIYKDSKFLHRLSEGTTQIGTRAVFALIIMFVALAEGVGAENILGAFLAGCIVSLLKPDQEMVHKLDSFGYGFFIPIFFIMVGVEINLKELFSDPSVLIVIPLLLLAFFLSKLIPVFVLKKWYDMNTTIASVFILTSTLSLVIAAAKIAENLKMISSIESGVLILSAVIACIVTPVFFKKFFPAKLKEEKALKVAFIGHNTLSVPVAQSIKSGLYEATLYYTDAMANQKNNQTNMDMIKIENYSEDTLVDTGIFNHDILVCSANDDDINRNVAQLAKEHGVNRVICRLESTNDESELKSQGIEIFNVINSTKTLLRGLIESPNMLNLLSNEETTLYEIQMLNYVYQDMRLRHFPFGGDIIFVRILRENESLVPHGDTELRYKDRLIVTGSREYVEELKRELEMI